MIIRRGDIYYADLRPVVGSEQGGIRPVLVVQNDTGNRHSPTVIVAAITSKMNKAKLPTHIELSTRQCNIMKDSVILLEQLRTIDKQRLKDKVCHLDDRLLAQVNRGLRVSLDLDGIHICLPIQGNGAKIDKKFCHKRADEKEQTVRFQERGAVSREKECFFRCQDIQSLPISSIKKRRMMRLRARFLPLSDVRSRWL